MAYLSALLFAFSLTFSGIDVTYLSDPACDARPDLMGSYFIGKDQVVLCVDNIEREQGDPDVVLHHELLHAVHENFGVRGSFFNEKQLAKRVSQQLDFEEVLSVVMSYPVEELDQELEVRVLSNQMSEWHMALVIIVSRLVELLRLTLGS